MKLFYFYLPYMFVVCFFMIFMDFKAAGPIDLKARLGLSWLIPRSPVTSY